MKTARFTTIVEAAGKPTSHVLWVPAEKDPSFQRAVKDHRIMTVHQDVRGTRKDYGTVGFTQGPEAQYLVFPKSLKRFTGRRVVGINYTAIAAESKPSRRPASEAKPTKPKIRSQPRPSASATPPRQRQRPPDTPAATNVLEFTPEERPQRPATPKPPLPSKRHVAEPRRTVENKKPRTEKSAAVPREVIQQIRRAANELKAGKAEAAYEHLQQLLNTLGTS
jgi:hypothetical protein